MRLNFWHHLKTTAQDSARNLKKSDQKTLIKLALSLAEGVRKVDGFEGEEALVSLPMRCFLAQIDDPRRLANCSAKWRRRSVRSGLMSNTAASVSSVKRSS